MPQPAISSSLKTRQGLLQSTLCALDEAIARSPDNEALKTRREALADELKTFAMPGEIEWLHAHLAELDAEMARVQTATTADHEWLSELLRDREQTLADINEVQRWGAPRGLTRP